MADLSARLTAIAAGLAAACPLRIVTRNYCDFAARKSDELKAGVYTLISLGEGGYKNLRGRAAMDGKHRMLLTAQIKLPEKTAGVKTGGDLVEAAELAMVEEVKTFLRALPAGLACLEMTDFRQSGQIEAPFGWAAMDLEYRE